MILKALLLFVLWQPTVYAESEFERGFKAGFESGHRSCEGPPLLSVEVWPNGISCEDYLKETGHVFVLRMEKERLLGSCVRFIKQHALVNSGISSIINSMKVNGGPCIKFYTRDFVVLPGGALSFCQDVSKALMDSGN